jgi:hypothetical protein
VSTGCGIRCGEVKGSGGEVRGGRPPEGGWGV